MAFAVLSFGRTKLKEKKGKGGGKFAEINLLFSGGKVKLTDLW